MRSDPVAAWQRFRPEYPCPVCGGDKTLRQHTGTRCYGFIASTGDRAACTRQESEQPLPSSMGCWHQLGEPCSCGATHPLADLAGMQNGHVSLTGDAPHGSVGTGGNITDRVRRQRRVIMYRVRRIVTAEGELVALHHRIDYDRGPKALWWERNGRKGLGGYPAAKLPLYNLPALRAAPAGTRVYVTEGEEACDALRLRNVLAVGTVTGAATTPSETTLAPLAGFEVVLWPDNDPEGVQHMHNIGARLYTLGARNLKWVEWPDAPESGDAVDFVYQHDGAVDGVDALVHEYRIETDAWEDPLPLPDALPAVEPFDAVRLLPDVIRAWIEDAAERMQAPIDFVAASAVTVAGALIGRRVGIYPKKADDWLVVPNLWGLLVGRPAAMKTPALNETLQPIAAVIAAADTAFQSAQAEYEARKVEREATLKELKEQLEAAAKMLKKKDAPANAGAVRDAAFSAYQAAMAEVDSKPTQVRYKTSDATVEKLGELLLQNPAGLLVHRDEMSGLLRSFNKKGREGDRSFYLEAWNGLGGFDVDRIGRGSLHIPALCISLLGTIQPGPLGSFVRATGRGEEDEPDDDGLLQRFQLLVWPDVAPYRHVDRAPDKQARARAEAIYGRLVRLGAEFRIAADPDDREGIPAVRFNAQAQDIFDCWRTAHERRLRQGDLPPALESHLVKYRKLVPALALIFQALEDTAADRPVSAVDAPQIERAVAWVPFLTSHAQRLYHARLEPALDAARLLRAKLQTGEVPDGVTVRDLVRHHWSGLDTLEMMNGALAELARYGWVRVVALKGRMGRSSLVVRLHPACGAEAHA